VKREILVSSLVGGHFLAQCHEYVVGPRGVAPETSSLSGMRAPLIQVDTDHHCERCKFEVFSLVKGSF
jgi:hypothetical protein